ncbi:Periplasmic nitrate reductase component NapL [hydrothermal vent metagenome]|uniref:Periplasmic nitrate reductase component NapL n=1 Tax=hydrothermal vent metagenome TaxID=652676 RepID=A0A1W1BU67_9ZZZZ
MFKKIFLLFVLSGSILSASQIKPSKTFSVHGNMNDIIYKDGLIYAATANGKVDILSLKSGKIKKEISLSKIKDFMGDTIDSEVFSVDVIQNKILILSQDNNGYTRLDIYQDGKLIHILDKSDKLYIVKAKFISKNKVLLALLSNVYMLYDIQAKKIIWQEQITMSKFSNFALNDNKTKVASADESGDVNIVLLKDGKILKHFDGVNKDEVFGIDWSRDLVITGGKDKKVGLYDLKSSQKFQKEYSFFIYSVALSSDAKLAAASVNDKNDVVIFDTVNREDRYRLIKNSSKIVSIIFLNSNKDLLVAANNDKINLYHIKGK